MSFLNHIKRVIAQCVKINEMCAQIERLVNTPASTHSHTHTHTLANSLTKFDLSKNILLTAVTAVTAHCYSNSTIESSCNSGTFAHITA